MAHSFNTHIQQPPLENPSLVNNNQPKNHRQQIPSGIVGDRIRKLKNLADQDDHGPPTLQDRESTTLG